MKKRIIIYLLIFFSVFFVADVNATEKTTYKYQNVNDSRQYFTITIQKDQKWCNFILGYGIKCQPMQPTFLPELSYADWSLLDSITSIAGFDPNIKAFLSANIDENNFVTFLTSNEGTYRRVEIDSDVYDATGTRCDYYADNTGEYANHSISLTVPSKDKYQLNLFFSNKSIKQVTQTIGSTEINVGGDFYEIIQESKGTVCPTYASYDKKNNRFYVGSTKQTNMGNVFTLNGKLNCEATNNEIKRNIEKYKKELNGYLDTLKQCYDEESNMITCNESLAIGASNNINRGPLANYIREIEKIDLVICPSYANYVEEEKANLKKYTEEVASMMVKIKNAKNASINLKESVSGDLKNIDDLVDNNFDLPEEDKYLTCESLVGSEFVIFLNKIFGYVKILAPILLILFGSIDFGKAVLTDDKDALSKATKNFIKRAIAAVAIFFVPTIINIIFSLVDGINGTTCGIM